MESEIMPPLFSLELVHTSRCEFITMTQKHKKRGANHVSNNLKILLKAVVITTKSCYIPILHSRISKDPTVLREFNSLIWLGNLTVLVFRILKALLMV